MRDDRPSTGWFSDGHDVLWLSGADHLDFLGRMSTNSVADLAPGFGRGTAVLSDTGRVVDLVSCHRLAAGSALVTSGPGAAAALREHLQGYVLYGDDVRVTDASEQVTVVRVVGPAAADVLAALGLDPALAPGEGRTKGTGAAEIWWLRHPTPVGLGGFDLVVPSGAPVAALTERLTAAGAGHWSPERYAAARIAAGVPAYGAEIDGQANPLELALGPVIDFEKGCYIGQEVVARLDTYDKVQRWLARLVLPAAVAPGTEVAPADAAAGAGRRTRGRVTSSAADPESNGWCALALVPRALRHGAAVVVDGHAVTAAAVRATATGSDI